jgi:hypothetical protein
MRSFKLVSALLLIGVGWNAPATAEITEQVRDWRVSCDDELNCNADVAATDINQAVRLIVRRDGAIGAPIDIVWAFETAPTTGTTIRLQLTDVDYAISGEVVRVRPGNEVWWPGYAPDEKLVQMLLKSQAGTVTIRVADSTDQVEGSVSLRGVTAALAVMDFAQRRVERTDAVVIVGGIVAQQSSAEFFGFAPDPALATSQLPDTQPADTTAARAPEVTVPAEPTGDLAAVDDGPTAQTTPTDNMADDTLLTASLELFSAQPFEVQLRTQLPSGLIRELSESYFCRTTELLETMPAIAYPITKDRTLWRVPCNTTTFHSTHMFVESNRFAPGELTVHTFGYPPATGFDAETDSVDPAFDAQTGQLTSFVKSRSQGDCGIFATYRWTGDGFDLQEYREKKECDGSNEDPSGYPLVWQNS